MTHEERLSALETGIRELRRELADDAMSPMFSTSQAGMLTGIASRLDALLSAAPVPSSEKPRIICFCGSSRFCDVMAVMMWEAEKRGDIAMGLHYLPPWYSGVQESHQAEHEGIAEQMDELHKRKIDLADDIFVVNVNGYIGSSTRSEIEYATRHGKPVHYLEEVEGEAAPSSAFICAYCKQSVTSGRARHCPNRVGACVPFVGGEAAPLPPAIDPANLETHPHWLHRASAAGTLCIDGTHVWVTMNGEPIMPGQHCSCGREPYRMESAPLPPAESGCEHVWVTSLIQMPQGYAKPGASFCSLCLAPKPLPPAQEKP